MIYSLLISERFTDLANPDNILLYILDDSVKAGFEVIKQVKSELDRLILARNELAKWQQLNRTQLEFTQKTYSDEDFAKVKVVKLPPMIEGLKQECQNCFVKGVCNMSFQALESDQKPTEFAKDFPNQATDTVKEYFRRFVECVTLEQGVASRDRP